MGPVDYDRTAETIEEVRRVDQETGIPVLTAEQLGDTNDDTGMIKRVLMDKSKATIEEPVLKRFTDNWEG
jgi:hypothetical protein